MVLRVDGSNFNFSDGDKFKLKPGEKLLENVDIGAILRNKGDKKTPSVLPKTDGPWSTDLADENGNLKPGVPLESVLNEDGTLKYGWTVDLNGQPKYNEVKGMGDWYYDKASNHDIDPRINKPLDPGFDITPEPRKITIDGKEFTINPKDMDPGFDATPIPEPRKVTIGGKEFTINPGKDMDPGFDQTPRLPREKIVYEVKDGKLVSKGSKFMQDIKGQGDV